MDFHAMNVEKVLSLLSSGRTGLKSEEAEKRILSFGENEISGKKKRGIIKKFIEQFKDFMIITLIVSAFISFFISLINGDGDLKDPIIILSIVVFNATLGVIQESRAENAINALKSITSPKAIVLRDGKKEKIDAKNVAKGDVILLSSGDMVVADVRLIETHSFSINESSLTGEANAISKDAMAILDKDTPLAERYNMAYKGTLVIEGHAVGVVVDVGMDTEVGKLASLLGSEKDEDTPLQKRLAKTGKTLALMALLSCFLVFIIGVLKNYSPFYMFMTSVSLAVASIPEGLPAIVTIMLALGVSKMAKKKAVVRNLPAVETLGSATVICSDKTGTLTKNEMAVMGTSSNEKEVLTLMALCSDSDGETGSPTENAIIKAYKGDVLSLRKEYKRVGEIPFSSKIKKMTTNNLIKGEVYTITKGAFDVIIDSCKKILDNGKELPLSKSERDSIKEELYEKAKRGMRIIAVSVKKGTFEEKDMTYVGAVYIKDPVREEVKEAVSTCKKAGIRVIMITGDHKETALSVAKEIGIPPIAMTGEELSKMTEGELKKALKKVSVFARVIPEHKVLIVKALKDMGEVVAMTGDGVNDAPALSGADIGCAMGKGGTDVAREASDMVLMDDNFATIVSAVKEGRNIYANIKKAVHFLLSSNTGEIIVMLGALLFGIGAPLMPIQLLWVNLITDSLPAIALGMDKTEEDLMKKKPIKKGESFFSGGLLGEILLEGVLIGATALTAYYIGLYRVPKSEATARTICFCTLCISQLFHSFNVRSKKSIFLEKSKNFYLFGAFIVGFLLQWAVVFFPYLASVFGTCVLNISDWIIVLSFSLVPILIAEIEKALNRASIDK